MTGGEIMSKNRRTVLKALGGALTVGSGVGIVGAQQPEWRSTTFIFREAAPGKGKAPGAGGGSGCKESGEWNKFTNATWPNGATVSYKITDTPTDNSAINSAFQTWNNYLNSMSFAIGDDSSSDNEVTTSGQLSSSTLARATIWYTPSEIKQFLIEFNSNKTWGNLGSTSEECSPEGSEFDVENVATHEVGHTIGLGHPNNSDAHTMWGYATKGETLKRTLAKGDKNGANALY